MRLTKLQLVGFKSFASKTDFLFPGGTTAFVGPNGCGKTNVADAVRWALGEQKTAALRSESMENVIFNGSRNRKPLGMAEVTLQIENDRMLLPTEYDEVSITRRLFRDGKSEYLINNSKCRLRDISDLFMDTGMSADSYSVIELKMVEAILSGRPEERRRLFEEAAGVTKYKVRRKEAGRKLEAVRADLVRIEDIVGEKQKLTNSLKRQAAKTRRYYKLIDALKAAETTLFMRDYADFKEKTAVLEGELGNLKESRGAVESEIADLNENLEALKEKQTVRETRLYELKREESGIRATIAEKDREKAVSQERIDAARKNVERLRFEKEAAEKAIEEYEETLEKRGEKIEELNDELSGAEEFKENADEKTADAENRASTLRSETQSLTQSAFELRNKISGVKTEADRNQKRLADLRTNVVAGKEKISSFEKKIAELEKELNLKKSDIEKFDEKIRAVERELALARERKTLAQNEIDKIRNSIVERKDSRNRAKVTLDFLKGLVDSEESSKFLHSANWKPKGEKIALAELVGVDEEFRPAFESALGEAKSYFVVEDEEDAFAAAEALKSAGKGRAGFICKNRIRPVEPPATAPARENVLGRMSEIARASDEVRQVLRALLGDALLCRDSAAALSAIDSGECSRAATMEGDVFGSEGLIKSGSKIRPETSAVGKFERMKKLEREIEKLDEEIALAEADLEDAKENFDSIDPDEINRRLRSAESGKNVVSNHISKINFETESAEKEILRLKKASEEVSSEIKSLEGSETESAEKIISLEKDLEKIEADLEAKKKETETAESRLAAVREESRTAEMALVRLREERKSTSRDSERIKVAVEETRRKLEAGELETKRRLKESEELSEKIDSLSKEIDELDIQALEIGGSVSELEADINSIKEQIKAINADKERAAKEQFRLGESVHQKALSLKELETKISARLETAKEKYDIDLENYSPETPDERPTEEIRAELSDTSEKLSSIGPVNFMALEEYEEQRESLELYEKQTADLTESRTTLEETITEINETAEKKFSSTFDEVQKNFRELFRTLFGDEGAADIKLADENLLEADIIVEARPPGKRPHSIEMLSGGEKALTAISLLFAIYLVKPSPFCILDEVDAPLDDSNVDKFLKLIRRFSDRTQFLIVTHNKKTMSAADNLYGITMAEQGVSQVVSVRLNSGGEEVEQSE